MGKEKLVKAITSRSEDFTQWYTDIVKKAELIDYSNVRGCMILRPYGYAIWENIQKNLDKMFKDTGHENVYMPMFIPESLLQKEKDHIEGFAPEVAWVTHGGEEKLAERLCVRPTSEVLFCDHYSKIIQSHKDLPKLYNQWCSVVRWEKTTRPFLRSLEFLWQEGHTAHKDEECAMEETLRMLDVYGEFSESFLAMPVIKGQKTEKEKFAGAVSTYSIESMMHDGKALQAGTSHYFGDGFAKAFDIKYTDKDNTQKYIHQTSWGVSTRLIGGLIMTHSDDDGLVLPPKIAPIQVVIIPIAMKKEGVVEKAEEIKKSLNEFSVKLDITDKSPGWKFSEYEMKGVPIRVEIGPKDIEKNEAVIVRRDNREKIVVSLDNLVEKVREELENMQNDMLQTAKDYRAARMFEAKTYDEFKNIFEEKTGFVKAMWCGDAACEEKIKEDLSVTSRNIPFDEEAISDKCVCCGKEAKHLVYWAKAY